MVNKANCTVKHDIGHGEQPCTGPLDSAGQSSTPPFDEEPYDTFQHKIVQLCSDRFKFHNVTTEYMHGGSSHRVIGFTVRPSASQKGQSRPKKHKWFAKDKIPFRSIVRQFLTNDPKPIQYVCRIERSRDTNYNILHDDTTLSLICGNTKLPVPEVLGGDNTKNNVLGSPYVVHGRLPGRKLSSIWGGLTPAHRTQALQEVMQITKSLHAMQSDRGGVLRPCSGDLKLEQYLIDRIDKFDISHPSHTPELSTFSTFSTPQTTFTFLLDLVNRRIDDWKREYIEPEYWLLRKIIHALHARGLIPDSEQFHFVHSGLYPHNMLVETPSKSSLHVSGILGCDAEYAFFAPRFYAYRPPWYFWCKGKTSSNDKSYESVEEEALLAPTDPESKRLKDLFVSEAGAEWMRYAFTPEYIVARRLVDFLRLPRFRDQDWEEAKGIVDSWAKLHPDDDLTLDKDYYARIDTPRRRAAPSTGEQDDSDDDHANDDSDQDKKNVDDVHNDREKGDRINMNRNHACGGKASNKVDKGKGKTKVGEGKGDTKIDKDKVRKIQQSLLSERYSRNGSSRFPKALYDAQQACPIHGFHACKLIETKEPLQRYRIRPWTRRSSGTFECFKCGRCSPKPQEDEVATSSATCSCRLQDTGWAKHCSEPPPLDPQVKRFLGRRGIFVLLHRLHCGAGRLSDRVNRWTHLPSNQLTTIQPQAQLRRLAQLTMDSENSTAPPSVEIVQLFGRLPPELFLLVLDQLVSTFDGIEPIAYAPSSATTRALRALTLVSRISYLLASPYLYRSCIYLDTCTNFTRFRRTMCLPVSIHHPQSLAYGEAGLNRFLFQAADIPKRITSVFISPTKADSCKARGTPLVSLPEIIDLGRAIGSNLTRLALDMQPIANSNSNYYNAYLLPSKNIFLDMKNLVELVTSGDVVYDFPDPPPNLKKLAITSGNLVDGFGVRHFCFSIPSLETLVCMRPFFLDASQIDRVFDLYKGKMLDVLFVEINPFNKAPPGIRTWDDETDKVRLWEIDVPGTASMVSYDHIALSSQFIFSEGVAGSLWDFPKRRMNEGGEFNGTSHDALIIHTLPATTLCTNYLVPSACVLTKIRFVLFSLCCAKPEQFS
ncbi:unnamed protein product [Periconia digitata]|uniref:Aminoglycoside phosphotransferase domain-containing protein n=1 Tax=Periconia digitata TaxID=1303443 RepID=A0A9W4UB14_9PLEO|nr:unnamed protein product [Periconia digitata]